MYWNNASLQQAQTGINLATKGTRSIIRARLSRKLISFPINQPSASLHMYAIGVISELQVGEVLVRNDNLTLAWDATSIDANHMFHQFRRLDTFRKWELSRAGQPQTTRRTHTRSNQWHHTDICSLPRWTWTCHYVDCGKAPKEHTHWPSFCQTLEQDQDNQLLELKSIRLKCLVFTEDDTKKETRSDTFGREGCAVNFVYAMTKIRYKQGKGDPVGFNQQVMKQENIKPGTIVRYVGMSYFIMLASSSFFEASCYTTSSASVTTERH